MGVGSVFDGFGRIFNDPFCIKLNREIKQKRKILEEKHQAIMKILAEFKEEASKPLDNWDLHKLDSLHKRHEEAVKDYEDFANKNIRNYI